VSSVDFTRLIALVRGSLRVGNVAIAVGAQTLEECAMLKARVVEVLREAKIYDSNRQYVFITLVTLNHTFLSLITLYATEVLCEQNHNTNRVLVQVVFPWGQFTPALNALLALAVATKEDLILFQSVEVTIEAESVARALRECLGGGLVCGAGLHGHALSDGQEVR
jgi:hypothetical protein